MKKRLEGESVNNNREKDDAMNIKITHFITKACIMDGNVTVNITVSDT